MNLILLSSCSRLLHRIESALAGRAGGGSIGPRKVEGNEEHPRSPVKYLTWADLLPGREKGT